MPLFRRRPTSRSTEEFTVGVGNQRVVRGGDAVGVTMLVELRDYVGSVTGGAAEPIDGRDSVAVLSAKMDQAELVEDCAVATGLAFEELEQRGAMPPGAMPPRPALPTMPPRATHYAYIQASHARTMVRLEWLAACDEVLRAHGVGLLPPRPEDDPTRRPH